MAGKSKFQISRSLDEKLKKFITCNEECDPEFHSLESAFILGFNYSNVTNYVGLTTEFKLHNGNTPVVGLAYFKSLPDEQQIRSDLQPAVDYFSSPSEGLGSYAKLDKNEHLYLIYYKDSSSQVDKKIYDLTNSVFLQERPKLSVLDDAKIYAHSAIVKLSACFKLDLFKDETNLYDKEKLISNLDEARDALSNSANGLKIHLQKSNFSSSNPHQDNKTSLESLYSHLDIPDEVQQMGDYLPQVTREEKKRLADKWRNKVKDQRSPLEFSLEHETLSCVDLDDEKLPVNYYKLQLEEYLYLHVNDSLAKSTRYILLMLRQKLECLKKILTERPETLATNGTLKSCTFKPWQLNHFVPAVYLIPHEDTITPEDYKKLAERRREIHMAYLIAFQQPAVRYAQRVMNVELRNLDESRAGYLCNVHVELSEKSGIKGGTRSILNGTYTYHHYLQGRVQDNGWGCAYRSLQTIISWFKHQAYIYSPDVAMRSGDKHSKKSLELRSRLYREARVPTHEEIQEVLVEVGDKPASFVGTQKWIGSQEVCYVLDYLYNLESKFISVSSGGELVYKARDLGEHFVRHSTPVMIGGGVLAHTIIGLDFNEKNGDISYLILDPHYTGGEDLTIINKKGWCGWKKSSFWDKSAFYNLCLPQRPVEF